MEKRKGKINWSEEIRLFISRKIEEEQRRENLERADRLLKSTRRLRKGEAAKIVREDRDSRHWRIGFIGFHFGRRRIWENTRTLEGTFAPELILTESINSVLTALKRSRFENEQTENAIDVLLTLMGSNVRIFPQEKSLALESFRIAKETDLTSYDALYVALAMRLEGSLVSRDPKQLEAARKMGIKTIVIWERKFESNRLGTSV